MKKFCHYALLAAIASLVSSQPVSAVLVHSENADGLTAGTDALNDSANWSNPAGDYGVLAGGSVFTTNHFELTAPDANFNFANWNDGTTYPVLTFSLDLVDLGTSTSSDASVRLAIRRNSGSAFRDATAAGTPDNTIVHYDVVVNTTAAAVLYEDGVNSIAANTLELWVDGVLTSSIAAGGSGESIGVGLWNRRPDNAFLADNIEIRDTAYAFSAVPEPSSFAFLSLVTVGMAYRRKRG